MLSDLTEPGQTQRAIDPCTLVIFGATGDLTGRKLAPAIYNLSREGLLPPSFALVGFARRDKTHAMFRSELKQQISAYSRVKPIEEAVWTRFQEQIFYHRSEFDDDNGYETLKERLKELDQRLGTRGNRVFYLSVQPKFFPLIIAKLRQHGLIYEKGDQRWSRVIIEKPFGRDVQSAGQLQQEIAKNLDESQIYRIDHYLGKETVQNLFVFRFANSIFETLWNSKHIDHVQITVSEDIGIGTRGHFFEEEGFLRDILQNHMMQLLSLVALEPPVKLTADAIHNEKVKVLQSVLPLSKDDLRHNVVRGQYGPGLINGQPVVGYAQEKDVSPTSVVETFVALRLFIDNARWTGVPFYLRGGKRLPKRATEIAVTFKDAAGGLFKHNPPNVLALRIQPNEGIALRINNKVPGPSRQSQPVEMDFRYSTYFGDSPPEAYERLICECILGDSTLFARSDEVAHSWQILTPVLNDWAASTPRDFPNYAAGTWGPKQADELIAKDGRAWRIL